MKSNSTNQKIINRKFIKQGIIHLLNGKTNDTVSFISVDYTARNCISD